MSKKNKEFLTNGVEVEETEEIMEVEEMNEKKNFGQKVIGFGKKHGKKILAAVALVGVSALSYTAGKKRGSSGSFEDLDDIDVDDIDFDEFEEFEDETTTD